MGCTVLVWLVMVVAVLVTVLLAGDVESNPGPSLAASPSQRLLIVDGQRGEGLAQHNYYSYGSIQHDSSH